MAHPRYEHVSYSFGGPLTKAVKWLMVVCVGIWVLQQLPFGAWIQAVFGLTPGLFIRGLIWQPFTYMFLHFGVWHIAMNMLMLFMFGCQIERFWGARKFVFYFLLTGLAGDSPCSPRGSSCPSGRPQGLPPPSSASSWPGPDVPDRKAYLIPFPVAIPAKWFAVILSRESSWAWSGASRRTCSAPWPTWEAPWPDTSTSRSSGGCPGSAGLSAVA